MTLQEMSAPGNGAPTTNWKNVNNWHWVEKNCLPWARDYLTAKLLALPPIHDSQGRQIEGDVDMNVRKGKIKYLFDLQLCIEWKGVAGEESTSGEINLRDCLFDEEPQNYETDITCTDESSADKKALMALVRCQLRPSLNPVFVQFPKDLLEECGPGMLVASAQQHAKPPAADVVVKEAVLSQPASVAAALSGPSKPSETLSTVQLTVKSEFKASSVDLYECLTDPGRVSIWTGDKAIMEQRVGSPFSLMGGNITGMFEELVPGFKIVMRWRLKSWPQGHHSVVTMTLNQGLNSTTIEVSQKGVPRGEEELLRRNWQAMYFDRIKHIFGYVV